MPETTFNIIKLSFESGVHLSQGKNVYDESASLLHSDTLKAALFACAIQIFGPEKVNRSFLDDFTVSSAFPFYKNELFFPKPFSRIQPFNELVDEGQQPKKIKKISFLGKSYFEDLINGGQKKLSPHHLLAGGDYISESFVHGKPTHVIQSDVQQRVFIPQAWDEEVHTRPYYVDRLFFHPEAGLYFILTMNKEESRSMLNAALRLLGDQGIGTDRNVGNGQFTFSEDQVSIQIPEHPDQQLLLSLYCPEATELSENDLKNSSYQLIKRGGYLASAADVNNITLRKRSVFMFAEGSVFSTQTALEGKLVDLKPKIATVKHPVWRDGRPFALPVKSITT